MNRLITTMIILCLIVMIACTINITILINHLSKSSKRTGSLYSTVIDNVLDYITYMICLLFIEMSLVFWTYNFKAINYCLYPIYGYKKNKILENHNFRIEKNNLCYVFCKHVIDKADNKRLILRKQIKQLNSIDTPTTRPMKSSILSSKYHSKFSNIDSNTEIIDFQTTEIPIDETEMRKIEIILYDFDGVLTTECKYRYFEHWNDNDITSLTRKHMNTIFGDDKRINIIKNNFIKWKNNGKQIKIISYENTNKINRILNKIGLDKYFDKENDIIGCDNKIFDDETKFSIKYFILKLISMQQIEYDEILYISADEENVTHFKNINLCQCYHIKLNGGINENDIKLIDTYYY